MIDWCLILIKLNVTSREISQVIRGTNTRTQRIRKSALFLHWKNIFVHIQTFLMEILLFSWKQPIRPLHKNISQSHTWQKGNVSYYWWVGALVRVPFVSEGSNNSVLVWMHGLSPYCVYLLEGLLEHGPSRGSVHPLQKGRWSIHRPISDGYIIFDEIICDFSASLGFHRFNRRRYGRENWSTTE